MESMIRLIVVNLLIWQVFGQQQQVDANCDDSTASTIAATVVCTLVVSALILACLFFGTQFYKSWKARKGQHLMLETDPERGKGEYAFDNPGFKDAALSPSAKTTLEKSSKDESPSKLKWNQWSPLAALSIKNEVKQTSDDSEVENQVKVVTLRSHDFTGLGFNICGNMKEGIYIKDILHRGPASESKRLNAGDRIRSVTIDFDHVVYEDALAILSYASPYEIAVAAQSSATGATNILRCFFSGSSRDNKLVHPVYRSSSSVSQKTKWRSRDGSNEFYAAKVKPDDSVEPKNKGKVPPKPSARTSLPFDAVKRTVESFRPTSMVEDSKVQQKNAQMHKIGAVQVLPQKMLVECNQNVNNLNHESEKLVADKKVEPPAAKKREKLAQKTQEAIEDSISVEIIEKSPPQEDAFNMGQDCNEMEVPADMSNTLMNAANAAKSNRRSLVEDDAKAARKLKGKAPAPPPNNAMKEIQSDSESEANDSPNKFKLDANDITIHRQSDEEEGRSDGQDNNRKTLSTGDLTKIEKRQKSRSGTLERAQSLDITDSVPSQELSSVAKKRKATPNDDISISDEDDSLLNTKEPRLAAVLLDGLNTFQRSRLKKSTEWGNMEDAIMSTQSIEDMELAKEEEFKPLTSVSHFNFGVKSPEFDALVNKINEIRQETAEILSETQKVEESITSSEEARPVIKNKIWPFDDGSKVSENSKNDDPESDLEQEQPKVVTVNEKLNPPSFDMNVLLNFLEAERANSTHFDINVPDDIKVSRHSFVGISEAVPSNISNVKIEAYVDESAKCEVTVNSIEDVKPDLIKSVNYFNGNNMLNEDSILDGPSSLTFEVNTDSDDLKLQHNDVRVRAQSESDSNENITTAPSEEKLNSKYITEIQVISSDKTEGEPLSLDKEEDFEKYIKKFENNIKSFESNIQNFETNMQGVSESMKSMSEAPSIVSLSKSITQIRDDMEVPLNAEKELQKVQEIAEEQLKKLPEMRFTTSSYESSRVDVMDKPNRHSQIEILKSNFEKPNQQPLARNVRSETSPPKSRIPVLNKTPPTSPERRDSKNFDQDKELMELMASKYQQSPKHGKNVTVTSIKNNSKIPSGVSIYSKPPVPPKKVPSDEDDNQQYTNGSSHNSSSFKQWVFGPGESVTNITVSDPNKI